MNVGMATGRAVSFLGIFVSNFLYSVFGLVCTYKEKINNKFYFILEKCFTYQSDSQEENGLYTHSKVIRLRVNTV
jgi:hypothetical protein